MKKTVAVLTDATSAGYLFPHWVRYYSEQFGLENLHVVTYSGLGDGFSDMGLGTVVELGHPYDDTLRASVISESVATLLERYDVVIRCDVDEFLVADPRKHKCLASYVEGLDTPYVTAIGLDLIETGDDLPLDLSAASLIAQRKWCIKTAALNKTSIVSRPVVWAAGFHAANVPPKFDDLFLLHLKFADIRGRIAWFSAMSALVRAGSPEFVYYDDGQAKLTSFADWINSKPKVSSEAAFDDTDFKRAFLASVERNEINGIWQGRFEIDGRLVAMPALFRDVAGEGSNTYGQLKLDG